MDYPDIINWESDALLEPPYVTSHTNEELSTYYQNPLKLDISSHSVMTERAIRDVTSLATATTSYTKREGMIKALHQHRQRKKKQ